MAGSDFRQMDIGRKTSRLELLDLLGFEIVSQVLRDGVGIRNVVVRPIRNRDVEAAPRVTFLIRSINCRASWLSATFFPSSRA